MPTINESADHIADVIGVDPQDVRYVARRLRENGLLPQAGRGRGGAQFGARHVSLLVLATMTSVGGQRGGQIDRAADNLTELASLSHGAAFENLITGYPLPSDLVGVVAALLRALASPARAEAERNIHDVTLIFAGETLTGQVTVNSAPSSPEPKWVAGRYRNRGNVETQSKPLLERMVILHIEALTKIARLIEETTNA
jgi:DNA-binding transcriptional ArsR family regulator